MKQKKNHKNQIIQKSPTDKETRYAMFMCVHSAVSADEIPQTGAAEPKPHTVNL